MSVLAKQAPGTPGAAAADRLAEALAGLAKANLDVRVKAEAALVTPLKITLDDIRQSLTASKVTLANLPKPPCFGLAGRRWACARLGDAAGGLEQR